MTPKWLEDAKIGRMPLRSCDIPVRSIWLDVWDLAYGYNMN
jgi:hypothetical protein